MILKKIVFSLSVIASIVYMSLKNSNSQLHSKYFIGEIIVLLFLVTAIIYSLRIGFASNTKYLNIINIVAGLFLMGYLIFMFGNLIFLLDKINFGLILILILISTYQSTAYLKRKN